MDMKQIKELISAMEKAGLKKIRIKEEKGFEIEIEKQSEYLPTPTYHRPEPIHHSLPPASSIPHKGGAEETHRESHAHVEGKTINSPMVGTFYSSASPDDPAYVKVGDQVEEDTIVCIIEAMKVMNEVKAGKKGKIVEILVHNAEPVEFGSKLFRIV